MEALSYVDALTEKGMMLSEEECFALQQISHVLKPLEQLVLKLSKVGFNLLQVLCSAELVFNYGVVIKEVPNIVLDI